MVQIQIRLWMIVQLNDESIEIEEEPEPVDEGLPKEAEPPVDDASPPLNMI